MVVEFHGSFQTIAFFISYLTCLGKFWDEINPSVQISRAL